MQMAMHSSTHKTNVSLAQEFQKHLSNVLCKNVVINKGNYIKGESKWKCTEKIYHVKADDDVMQKGVEIFCDTTQFSSFLFFWSSCKTTWSDGFEQALSYAILS